MKIRGMIRTPGKGLCLFLLAGATGFVTGCQCPSPVREIQAPCSPCHRTCDTAGQNAPDGIHHLAGGPLYYEPQNLNWEQAPPFGTW